MVESTRKSEVEQQILIKSILPASMKHVEHLSQAVKEAPTLIGRWKDLTNKHLENSRQFLSQADKSEKPEVTAKLFKSGMEELSIASTMLTEQMTSAEKVYKAATVSSIVIVGVVILTEAALMARYYQAVSLAAKSAALAVPVQRMAEVSESINVDKSPQAQRLASGLIDTVKAIVEKQPEENIVKLVGETRDSLHAYADKMGFPSGTIKYVEELLNTIKDVYIGK